MDIAIVGAGLAGLICARRLREGGHRVRLFEGGDEIGGRIRTLQTEIGGFDYGAQYFTAASAAFREEVARWRKAGWIAPWKVRIGRLESAGKDNLKISPLSERSAPERFVGVPGMQSLVHRLAEGLDIRCGQFVTRIERHENRWLLRIRADTVPIEASAGPFDAVVLAVPAERAAPLVRAAPHLARAAERIRHEPCWSLMLGFSEPLGLGYDAAWVDAGRLAWIALDASKPERRPGEHWVLHAPREWSVEHLGDDPVRVAEKLLKAFHGATGSRVQPVYQATHLWRHAQARQTLDGGCLWDPELRIGACGDWFAAGLAGGGKIENAFLSGAALASQVTRTIVQA